MKTSPAKQAQTIAELRQELETRNRDLAASLQRESATSVENVRLFKELPERNAELREALEHQTATSEVLGIISRSPTDVQPVLDAIVESAARVCGIDDVVLRLREGNAMVARAHFGPIPVLRAETDVDAPLYVWLREHGAVQVPDVRERTDLYSPTDESRWRTILSVPLRQQGELIGSLFTRRMEVRPFTPAQIKLLETFSDQAVIAIENVRLFNELKESLEQKARDTQGRDPQARPSWPYAIVGSQQSNIRTSPIGRDQSCGSGNEDILGVTKS